MIAVDYIAQEMKRRDMRLWCYPGGTIFPLFDACHRYGVETVVARSEAGAGFMAIGAAKATGNPQVVAVTSGPGATNLVTPIADAYYDSVPIIGLCGQVGTQYLDRTGQRQRGFQQTPTADIMRPIVKGVWEGGNLAYAFSWALGVVMDGRRGPAVIDMPMDLQKMELERDTVWTAPYTLGLESNIDSDIDALIDLIREAKRPLIVAGAGCRDAYQELCEFVQRTKIPVTCSLPAVGLVPTYWTQYVGMLGHTGHPSANNNVYNADLIIALGARLDVRQTGSLVKQFAQGAKVVRVDIDAHELTYSSVRIDLAIKADCLAVLKRLRNVEYKCAAWYETRTRFDGEVPQIINTISGHAPTDCIFTTGVGSHQQHAARNLLLEYPRRQFITSAGHGCMGAGLPMAIGAALATGKDAVLIDGDGSFQMSMNELASVQALGLSDKIDIHIIHNGTGGLVSQFARLQGWQPKETTWRNPRFDWIGDVYRLKVNVHRIKQEGVWPMLEGGHLANDMTDGEK